MVARRSSRTRARDAIDAPDADQGNEDDVLEDDSEAAPVPKRRKQAATSGGKRTTERKNASKKQKKKKNSEDSLNLDGMPLDVLIEIFSLVHPLDLLHLSRTNKALRGTLMSRDSAFLWKTVVGRLSKLEKLPPCPPDLTEPQYVHLMFEWMCTFCNAATIDWGQWVLRVRCCRTCMKTELLTEFDAYKMLSWSFASNDVPLDHIAPSIEGQHWKPLLHSGTYYLKSDIAVLKRKFEGIAVIERIREEHEECTMKTLDEDKLHELVSERASYVALTIMHARKMKRWQRANSHEREVDAIRARRKYTILGKLRDLGYSKEIDEMNKSDFDNHPFVKPAKVLTDRAWAGIKDNMIQFMEDIKAERLAREWKYTILPNRLKALKQVLEQYRSTRSESEIIPPPLDICLMKEVLAIVDAPRDVQVNEASFADIVALLPELSERWRDKVRRRIFSLVPESAAKTGQTLFDTLSLATTLFSCSSYSCRPDAYVTYDRLYVHTCMTEGRDLYSLLVKLKSTGYTYPPAVDFDECCQSFGALPWESLQFNMLVYNEKASGHARYLVEMCEKGADSATAAEMDTLDHRFECVSCKKLKGAGLSWRQAVMHAARLDHSRDDFRLHGPEETAALKNAEASKPLESYNAWYCRVCMHCRYSPGICCNRRLVRNLDFPCYKEHIAILVNPGSSSEAKLGPDFLLTAIKSDV